MYSLDGVALANKDYVAEQYRRYQADPASVDARWAAFFAGFELANGNGGTPAALLEGATPAAERVLDASDLVHSFRELGHLVAHLNPLEPRPMGHPLLDPAEFGFTDADMGRVVDCAGFRGPRRAPLGELIERLRGTYCGTLGVEYLHIPDKEQRDWLQDRMEPTENRPELAPEDRIRLLESLLQAEAFEQFLQVRYPTAKRFSLEGGEALVPMLDALIEEGGTLGADEMVFGMPHRGRLNVLANVIRKPYEMILSEFEGTLLAREATGDGDVKYHLGYSRDHVTGAGHKVHLSLSANPSHLEAVDPVIEGIVRAKQDHYGDRERERVVPVLLHGDAAFNGQGVVTETLGLSELPGYHVGGTIHIIVDNQIGFTTPPGAYRFTRYPSDVTKIILAPVFHVNGDDPEAAMHAARLAIGFRQRFKKDAVINLVCYRRHGHNELDDPTFTQPLMYKAIAAHPTVFAQYRERLVSDGAIAADDIERRVADFRELLDAAQGYARDFMPRQPGFEFGVSLADPRQLVIWEAQFGDFANAAQVVIDQFISSSESKWQRTSGIVLLLPHGYEGQGPEHSSARLERFLQLCAEDNMQVCNLTTPAQYFHALRRQMHRNFRKPLVVMSPKSLLRHKLAVSPLGEFTEGTFRTVVDDVAVDGAPEAGVRIEPSRVRRVLLCSGRIYYALLAGRRQRGEDTVPIVRVEQLYPFPAKELEAIFAAYPNAQQVCWVQEEPWNMGGWHTMYRRLRRVLPEGRELSYVGRAEAASPATGSYKVHQAEERDIVMNAFARERRHGL